MSRSGPAYAKIAWSLTALGVLLGPAVGTAPAQLLQFGAPQAAPAPGPARADNAQESAENTFPAPDRATLQQFRRAKEALDQARYGEALEGFGEILKTPEDYFFQSDKKAPIYRSLKAETRQLIGQMPPEGRQLYELRCGGEAREMLRRALAEGDAARLAEVSDRYFHTAAGCEATFLLGSYHLDHGSPLAGALTLRRLRDVPAAADRFEPALTLTMAACWLQAAMPDEAGRALADLKRRRPKSLPRIGGREVAWFDRDDQAGAWLAQWIGTQRPAATVEADRWAMHRGEPARNASTLGSLPLLNLRWRVGVSEEPVIEAMLQQVRHNFHEQGVLLFSALHPLAVDDVVLMRTDRNLAALDFATGKRIWEVPSDDGWDSPADRSNPEAMFRHGAPQLTQRIWDDATYGTLSSDGRRVFSIEDLGLGISNGGASGVVMFGATGRRSDAAARALSNRLTAHDVHSGKLEWELGGPGGQSALRQAETFFLGPPLPLRGQLYVLAETKDEIRLMALEAHSGRLLWAQQVAMVERSVMQDPLRRAAGVSPSYCDGILVCPTGADAVVAVDLATRGLLWGYRFGHGLGAHPSSRRGQNMAFRYGMYAWPTARWLDATATIVDGRVLLTPPESDFLYCLNLADGQPAWEPLPRQENLYVACVHRGTIVLVGRHEVRGVRLADGKPAWDGRSVVLPADAAPAGRGFYAGHQYFVPLSSAEVIAVDLDAGVKTLAAKSRKGNVPGNLVCYRGRVISQGLDGLETFYQVDAVREEIRGRLAAKPDDAEALSLRGEMRLDEGKAREAVADFRRACQLDPHGVSRLRTRQLLRDALLDGLRADFAGHRSDAPEIERLLDEPAQWALYLRLMTGGLQQAGDWRGALEHCLRLLDLEGSKRPLEAVDRLYLVRRDRWVQARLIALRQSAGPAAAAEFDARLRERLRAATEAQGVEPLRQFLNDFDGQPMAAEARRELLGRLARGGRLLEAELLLDSQAPAGDAVARAAAWAALAELYTRADRAEAAAACYRQLAGPLADVVGPDGRTGKQCLAALPAESPVRRELVRPQPAWPLGEVEVRHGSSGNAPFNFSWRFGVPFQGSPGPFFADATLRFETRQRQPEPNRPFGQQQQCLVGYDALGRQQWEVPLTEAGRPINFGYNPNTTQAKTQGHLLLLSMGTRIMAMDPLGVSGGPSRVAWSQDLTDATADTALGNRIIFQGGAARGINVVAAQLGGFPIQSPSYSRMNPFGPVTSRYVCFLRFRNLVVADPATGESLWVRQDLPPNSEVFGDEEFLFVLGAGQGEATVYRALDGELLGRRNVPRPPGPENAAFNFMGLDRSLSNPLSTAGIATLGRYVLTWEQGPRPDVDPFGHDDGTPLQAQAEKRSVLRMFDPWQQRAVWPERRFAPLSRACLVGDEAVGVFQPDGRFTLLALPGGRTIAEVKLEPERFLSEIFVTRLGDQYFLLTHDARQRGGAAAARPFQPLSFTLYVPIRRGRLYALDLQGQPAWPAPVTIQDQNFLLGQPARVPVLAFACQRFEQRPKQAMTMVVKTTIETIDRRTGRVLYNKDSATQAMTLDLVGHPDKKSVELLMQNASLTLNFTDKPVAPGSSGAARAAQPTGSILDALLQALGKPQGE